MKIALVQFNAAWESKRANYQMAEDYIRKAVREGCDLVVFPEMFNTGYSMNVAVVAEDEKGETAEVLATMASQYDINLMAGFAVISSDQVKARNIAVVYNRRGEPVAEYTKIHPFSFAREDRYYQAGTNPVVFSLEGVMASLFICYDLRFPEDFRKIAKDVQAIFVLANWPSSRLDHWKTLLKARAIENQCYVIGVNRTGSDGNGVSYPGASAILDPLGDEVCFGNDRDAFLTGEISPREVTHIRSTYPFLRDMLPTN